MIRLLVPSDLKTLANLTDCLTNFPVFYSIYRRWNWILARLIVWAEAANNGHNNHQTG